MHGQSAWGNPPRPAHVPCKHICAVLLRLVAAVDEAPHIIFGLRCVDPFIVPPRTPAATPSAASSVINLVEGDTNSQAIELEDSESSSSPVWHDDDSAGHVFSDDDGLVVD